MPARGARMASGPFGSARISPTDHLNEWMQDPDHDRSQDEFLTRLVGFEYRALWDGRCRCDRGRFGWPEGEVRT